MEKRSTRRRKQHPTHRIAATNAPRRDRRWRMFTTCLAAVAKVVSCIALIVTTVSSHAPPPDTGKCRAEGYTLTAVTSHACT